MKISEVLQKQIEFLKEPSTHWVSRQPRQQGEACAVVRAEGKYVSRIPIVSDVSPPNRPICWDLLREATVRHTNGKFSSIIGYNDSGTASKQDILTILKEATKAAIKLGH